MVKKIFDIIPPEKPLEEPEKEEILLEEKPREKTAKPVKEKGLKEEKKPSLAKPFSIKKVLVLAIPVVFLIILSVASYLYLPAVKIEIWIKTETLTFKEKLQASKETKIADALNHVLPGKIVIEDQSLSQEFSATGKAMAEIKAEGIVIIYNDYSENSQALVASTRFVSSEGKLFRLVERVVVPGQVLEKGKLVPGTIEAKVRADSAGPDYNIGASTFSIPGFAGTPKYTAIWAKSSLAMKGGFKGETTVVSVDDLNKAKEDLRNRISAKIDSVLASKTLPGLVLVKENTPLTIISEGTGVKIGDAAANFTYQTRAKKRAVLVSEEDLNALAQSYFASKLETDERFLSESLAFNPLIETMDEKTEKSVLSLEISGKSYQDLENQFLKDQLRGKTVQEIEKSFQDSTQVSQAKIRIFPSFCKNMPENTNKIEIKINFD